MKSDHRICFSNEIVSLQNSVVMAVTGTVTESQSGIQATYQEEE